MSKKRKSRFTKTDVNTICEMQRKIDAYEDYIIAIGGLAKHRNTNKHYLCLLKGTDMDDWMNTTWNNIQELIDDWNGMKKNGNG